MPGVFSMKRRVQFVETDMAGVLHFSNYFRLMEELECAFWRSLGPGMITTDGSRQISWPRVAVSCEYSEPARFEDELKLVLKIANISERSVSYEVDFLRDGKCIATGKAKGVCCAMIEDKFQAIAIPDTLRSKLENVRSEKK